MLTKPQLDAVVSELVNLQRMRSIVIKSRNMQANRLQAIIAGTLGYSSGMEEKDRKDKFKEAAALIKRIKEEGTDHAYKEIVLGTLIGIKAFEDLKDKYDKDMEALASKLHVAAWVAKPEQRGFSLKFLGIVIGETGNLDNYPNPAKVWRRLGCAPWTFSGKTLMGATWRKEGLPKEEWTNFGYSPRRRSIAYLIGEKGIVMQNKGPYKKRYDEAKAKSSERDDWTKCSKCNGTSRVATRTGSKVGSKACDRCKEGKVFMRCHLHAMLLATKLLLKNLWVEWHGHPPEVKHWEQNGKKQSRRKEK